MKTLKPVEFNLILIILCVDSLNIARLSKATRFATVTTWLDLYFCFFFNFRRFEFENLKCVSFKSNVWKISQTFIQNGTIYFPVFSKNLTGNNEDFYVNMKICVGMEALCIRDEKVSQFQSTSHSGTIRETKKSNIFLIIIVSDKCFFFIGSRPP